MQLTITQKAMDKINELNTGNYPYLLIWYDTEDCGCGVHGLPAVRLANEQPPGYVRIKNDVYQTLIDEHQKVFFSEKMKLDFINGVFRLSSPEEILNPFIPQSRLLATL